MSVFGVFSKQQQGALKVCCSEFSVRFAVSGEFSTESSVAECVSCIQDQEYVRKRPLGDPEHCSEVNLTDMFYTKIPIAPYYCQMMSRTLKEEIKITQYNNPTKAGKYSLEDLFRASDKFLTTILSSKMT